MRATPVAALLFLLALAGCAAPGFAAGYTGYAVVIGIRDYENLHLEKPLKYPDRDAQSFYNFLQTKQGGSFSVDNMKLLQNGNASRSRIIEALTWLGQHAKRRNDVVYVYFSGHGVLDVQGQAYLMPADGDAQIPDDKGWEAGAFLRLLETKISAGRLVLFIDACYAGAGQATPRDRPPPDLQAAWKETFRESAATHFAFSAARSEQSWESERLGGGSGVFTYYLLQGLQGEADRLPYGNADGTVFAEELYKYLRDKVTAYTKLNYELQTPTVSEGYERSFPMSVPGGGRAAVATEEASLPPVWEGPIFPLFPDPPDDVWPGPQGEDARQNLIEAKGFIERADLFCAAPPSFGKFARSNTEGDELNQIRHGATEEFELGLVASIPNRGDTWAHLAFDASDRSLAFQESPWARFYRGIALARLRAFTAAHLDLDRAVRDFRARGLNRYAEIASRLRILAGEWERVPAQKAAPATAPPGCTAASGHTTCELADRSDWPSLSADEKHSLVDRFKSLLDKPVCSDSNDCIALAPKANLHCASLLAEKADAAFAAEIHASALQYAARNGMTVEAEEQAEKLVLSLLEAGRSGEVDQVLRQRRNLWSPYQRSWIALRAALEPAQPSGSLAARASLLEIEPALKADLIALQGDTVQIRERLRRLDAAFAAANQEGGRSAKKLRLIVSDGASIARAEDYVGLRSLVDDFIATLGRIAVHPDGPIPLGTMHAELGRSLDALRRTLQSPSVDEPDEILLADLTLSVARFASYDAALRERGEPAWATGLKSLLQPSAGISKELEPYRMSLSFTSAVIHSLVEKPDLESLRRSLMFESFSSDSGESADPFAKAMGEFSVCFEKKLDEAEFLACTREGVWRYLEGLSADKNAEEWLPLGNAHRQVKSALLAKFGSAPTSEESWTLYEHGLIDQLVDAYTLSPPGALTQFQRDFLSLLIPVMSFLFEDNARTAERLAQAQSDNPEPSGSTSELVTLLSLLSPSDKEPLEVRAARAREAIAKMHHPFYRAFVLAFPSTYAGLSPDAIRLLIRFSGLQPADHGPGLLEEALWLTLIQDEDENVLRYDQKAVLASFLLNHEERVDTFTSIPLGPGFLPFAAGVSPLVFPSECKKNTLDPALSLTSLDGLQVQVTCTCCVWAPFAAQMLLAQASSEKLWSEAARWFSWLQERSAAHPEIDFGVTEAAASLLDPEAPAPPDLWRSALRELQRTVQEADLGLEQRLTATASLAAVFAGGVEKDQGITRDAVRDLLVVISRKLAEGPFDAQNPSLETWFDYLDAVGKAFEHLKDPELVFLWERQMTGIRGLLAAPRRLAAQPAEEGETPAGKAIHELEKRVEKGDARAMTHLGWILSRALGEGRDDAKAEALFARAAGLGDRESMQHLASLLSRQVAAGMGEQAVVWLQKSAALGNAEALTDLGRMFLEGRGVARDPQGALQWFRKAADQGSVEAMNELGLAYAMGLGTAPDTAAAALWLKKADRLGHPASGANLLALFHASGGPAKTP